MFKNKKAFALLLSALFSSSVFSGDQSVLSFEVSKGVPRDFVKKLVETYPSTKFKKISITPVDGVYEVQMGRNVVYVSSDARHMFIGHLVDMVSRKDLTSPVLRELRSMKVDVSDIPIESSIDVKKGNGSRNLYVFIDPDCPFCQKLEKELGKLNDVTIHYFMFPLSIHPNSKDKSERIYCAKDREKAIRDVIVLRKSLSDDEIIKECKAPIGNIIAYGKSIGIRGTPALIFEDGEMIQGYMPSVAIDKKLSEAHSKVSSSKSTKK